MSYRDLEIRLHSGTCQLFYNLSVVRFELIEGVVIVAVIVAVLELGIVECN